MENEVTEAHRETRNKKTWVSPLVHDRNLLPASMRFRMPKGAPVKQSDILLAGRKRGAWQDPQDEAAEPKDTSSTINESGNKRLKLQDAVPSSQPAVIYQPPESDKSSVPVQLG